MSYPPQPTQPPQSAGHSTRKVIAIAAGVAVAALALGAGGAYLLQGDDDGPTVAKATDAPTVATSNSFAPSPAKDQPALTIGDTADIDDTQKQFTAAALSYRDDHVRGIPELLNADQKWAVVEVKVCNKGSGPIQVSPFPWSLAYSDGVRVEATGTNSGQLPQPLYPMDAKVSAGDCVKGNIAFQVPKEGRPERVLYSPGGLDEPVEWQVGKG